MITYNPETITIENIHKLLFQSEKIVIVDNGSSNEVIYEVIRTFQNDERVEIILNEDNLGIAAALNIGVRRAIEMEYAWLATFDQDS
jgi:rhamnosyltransferase